MGKLELTIEIIKLTVALAGAVGVAWYWNRRKYLLEGYAFLDRAYSDLLISYFDDPRFGDMAKTHDFEKHFQGDDLLRYHYFAMRVHTVMETVYDLTGGRIPGEWKYIVSHHSSLHSAWLGKNVALHEPGYVAMVLGNSVESGK